MLSRFAGDIMQTSEEIANEVMRKAMQARDRGERQRQRMVAAAYGKIIPFSSADMRI